MADTVTKPGFGDARLAEKVIEAYAEDAEYESLSQEECTGIGFDADPCAVLVKSLRKGAEGEIDGYERSELGRAGFSKEFIERLAGTDGKAALRRRAKWLADNAKKRIWPFGYSENKRLGMLLELNDIGPSASDTVPSLIEILDKGDESVSWQTMWLFGKIGEASIPNLIAAFEGTDEDKRFFSAFALGYLGDDRAIEDLKGYFNDGDRKLRRIAAIALFRCNEADALAYLMEQYKTPSEERGTGGLSLIMVGAQAVPPLIEMMRTGIHAPSNEIQPGNLLELIGLPAIPALITLLNEPDRTLRINAVNTLDNIAYYKLKGDYSKLRLAIPYLERMAENDPDMELRESAKSVLDKILAQTL